MKPTVAVTVNWSPQQLQLHLQPQQQRVQPRKAQQQRVQLLRLQQRRLQPHQLQLQKAQRRRVQQNQVQLPKVQQWRVQLRRVQRHRAPRSLNRKAMSIQHLKVRFIFIIVYFALI